MGVRKVAGLGVLGLTLVALFALPLGLVPQTQWLPQVLFLLGMLAFVLLSDRPLNGRLGLAVFGVGLGVLALSAGVTAFVMTWLD